MDEFVYYALRITSLEAIKKADELKMNPDSANYKQLSDPRRAGMYMLLTVDSEDGIILHSMRIGALSNAKDILGIENITVVD